MNFLTVLFAIFFSTNRISEANLALEDYPQCSESSPDCIYECGFVSVGCEAILFWTHTPGNNYVQFNLSWYDEYPENPNWGGFGFRHEDDSSFKLHYLCLGKDIVPDRGSFALERFEDDDYYSPVRDVGIEPITTLTNGAQTFAARSKIGHVTSCVFNVYANRQVGDMQFDFSTPKVLFLTFGLDRNRDIGMKNVRVAGPLYGKGSKTVFDGIAPPLVKSAEIPKASLAWMNYTHCTNVPSDCHYFHCTSRDIYCQAVVFWTQTPGNNYVQFNISWYNEYPSEKWGAFGIFPNFGTDSKRNTIYYVCFGTAGSYATERFASSDGIEPAVAIESVTTLTNGVPTLAGRSESGGVTSCVFNVHANRVVGGVQFDLSSNVGFVAAIGQVTNNDMVLDEFSILGIYNPVNEDGRPLFRPELETVTTTVTPMTATATHNVVSVIAQILTVVFAANVW